MVLQWWIVIYNLGSNPRAGSPNTRGMLMSNKGALHWGPVTKALE